MLKHASIAGQPGEGVYVQTLLTGNFYIVLELLGDPAKVNLELGRNVVSKIEEVVSQTPEISPSELNAIVKQQLGEEIKLSIVVAFISGQKIILSLSGDTFAKVVRKGNVINLTQASVTGNLLENDLVIVGTAKLLERIDFQEILQNTTRDPETTRELLMPKIESGGSDQNIAGLLLKMDMQPDKIEDVEEEQEKIVATPPPEWGKKWGEKILYLKQAREQGFESAPHKKTLYLVVIVFVILLSVVAFQLRSRSLEVQNQNIAAIEKTTNEGIEASGKLIGLNDQLAWESLTQKREEVISEIEKNFGKDWKNLKSKEGDRLRAVIGKLDKEIARAANINNVSKLSSFYDFSLLKANPNITSAQLHEGVVMALDSENGSVYSLVTDSKSGIIVAGGNFKDNSFVDFALDNLFVYTPSGVRKKDISVNGAFKNVTKNATNSGKIAAMASFGGNLYLLDPENSQIWKNQGTEEGAFLPPVEYIQPGLNLDLSGSKGMVIDGFVYVFDKDRILKFASGAPEEFELKSLAMPIGSIDSLFASEETKNIYIWDATNNRIVVVNKEGVYQAQYQLPKVKNGQKAIILADEKLRKIMLVSGEAVFGVDIK